MMRYVVTILVLIFLVLILFIIIWILGIPHDTSLDYIPATLLPLLVFILLLYVCFKKSTKWENKSPKKNASSTEINEIEERMELTEQYKNKHIKTVRPKIEPPQYKEKTKHQNKYDNIKITDFEDYLFTALGNNPTNNEISLEFEAIKKLISFPTSSTFYSSRNMKKNRYRNSVPYDHTRVSLTLSHGSNYINASYINGYKTSKAFIATQTPLEVTIMDFWWMIWQENIVTIVMLSQLNQNQAKLVRYWPELRTKMQYGDITIKNTSLKIFPDYIKRFFEITFENQTRKIEHLEYTSWPTNNRLPLNPQSFALFTRIILRKRQTPPIVVHCESGCEKTGILILCDIILRMAAEEKHVNFQNVLEKLFDQRMRLIATAKHYIFAHIIVFECLVGKDFSIRVDGNFEKEMTKFLRFTTVKPIINYLEKIEELMRKSGIDGGIAENVTKKQDFMADNLNNFEAISVDCFKMPKKFIVTRQPEANTINIFWTLIENRNVDTIICLNKIDENNSEFPNIWSSEYINNSTPFAFLEECESNKILSVIKIKHKKDKIITVVILKCWECQTYKPTDINVLLSIYTKMREFLWCESTEIIVMCFDGITASGVFVALVYLLERIKEEQVCDVCAAIRAVRCSNQLFVKEWGQIELLYKLAVIYVDNNKN